MVVARGWGERKMGSCSMDVVSVMQDEKVLRDLLHNGVHIVDLKCGLKNC